MTLKDKIVVVTGGAGLIGQAYVEKICQEGGIPIIADINIANAKKVANNIISSNHDYKIEVCELDICCADSILDMIRIVESAYGKIDSIVNNAYPRNKTYGQKLENVTYESFCENVDLHLGGYFLVCKLFCDYFLKQRYGNIINISSIYGIIPPRFEIYNNTDMTMPVEYSVIKSAVIHLTKYLASYYKGKNIRVNTLSIGGIKDGQPQSFLDEYNLSGLNKGMLDRSDVVGSLVFLLSDESKYINGHNLIVDDGWIL